MIKSIKASLCTGLIIGIAFMSNHFWWFNKATSPLIEPQLSVIQANLSYYNPFFRTAVEELIDLKADLYLLYEFNQKHKPIFLEVSASNYKFGDAHVDGFPDGMGIISKYPLKNIKKHKILPRKGTMLTLTLQHPKRDIELILLHPPSPRTHDKWQKRNVLLGSVQPFVELTDNKYMLVAGDFNTTPWSRHFPKHHKLTPCYQQTDMYASWHPNKYLHAFGWLSGLPIDHCLTGKGIRIMSFNTLRIPGSDHSAIYYQLAF